MDVYLDRLFLTLPVINWTILYWDSMFGRDKDDADFTLINLSMCSSSITQHLLREKSDFIAARREPAIKMLQATLGLRDLILGEAATAEGAIAIFFIRATFSGPGMQKAAWLVLQQLVESDTLLSLYQSQVYHGLDTRVKGQRFQLLPILPSQNAESVAAKSYNQHDEQSSPWHGRFVPRYC
jgi:hypothetical protein